MLDFFILAYNSSGTRIWGDQKGSKLYFKQTVPWYGNANDYANAVAVDSSGNVLVAGKSNGTHDLGYAPIIKYNSSGSEIHNSSHTSKD